MLTAEFIVTEKKRVSAHKLFQQHGQQCLHKITVTWKKDMIPAVATRDGKTFLKIDRHTSVSTAAPEGRTHRKDWHS